LINIVSEFLRPEEIAQVIAKAIVRGNSEFMDWTGGYDIHNYGVETFISARIGGALFEEIRAGRLTGFITLESSFYEISKCAETRVQGRRTSILSDKNKIDVTYWKDEHTPVGLIEVKRLFYYYTMKKDIIRIIDMIKKYKNNINGAVQWGIVVGIHTERALFKESNDTLKEKFVELCEKNHKGFRFKCEMAKEAAKDKFVALHGADNMLGHCAFAVLIEPENI
jgi:hypothetical protein